ncbi:MAG: FIST C-terminal domain-containing protein [Alphaproteobacteria bacterium]|nr:FIST C-terminal domain-containing protein [Alphaproteobacteria bacterium]
MARRSLFKSAHTSSSDWAKAVKFCVDGLGSIDPDDNLGFVYCTESFANDLSSILVFLRQTTRIPHWVGAVGMGVCASGTEYYDGGALAVLVGSLPADAFRILPTVFTETEVQSYDTRNWLAAGQAPLGVVHGDPRNPRLSAIIERLSQSTHGFLVGGLTATRAEDQQVADTPTGGGISGVLLHPEVAVAVGLSQGCQPVGPTHIITQAMGNLVVALDGRPALDVLKEDVGEVLSRNLRQIAGYIHAGLPVSGSDTKDYLVRNLTGIDLTRGWIAIGDEVATGDRFMFVRRDANNAQADLRRMVRELRDRADGRARGGLYFSCIGRGPHMFGEPGAELALIAQELDGVPIAGFYANGEINNNRLYSYTGVLALFL